MVRCWEKEELREIRADFEGRMTEGGETPDFDFVDEAIHKAYWLGIKHAIGAIEQIKEHFDE